MHASVEVKPSYGLSDSEIETMLKASIEYAEEDMRTRMLAEQQVEADRVIEALRSALAKDGSLLTDNELTRIEQAKNVLLKVRQGDDEEKTQIGDWFQYQRKLHRLHGIDSRAAYQRSTPIVRQVVPA